MLSTPSRHAPSACDGRRGGGWKGRECEMLLRRLAVAMASVIVGVVIALAGGGGVKLVAAVCETAARGIASAEQGVRQSERSYHRQDAPARRVADVDAVEPDGDEDDDGDERLSAVSCAAPSLLAVPVAPKPERALRGEVGIDPSRFTSGPRLPRGPPAPRNVNRDPGWARCIRDVTRPV
jgi:hypothetical protein